MYINHSTPLMRATENPSYRVRRREKRRAAFKGKRRKISPEEQQQEITMGGDPQLYLVSRSWEAKHKRLLDPGKQKRPAYG
jgi:hypothetical protein